jgi:hypothetical protein
MLATTTHDTKRSEDVRARLAVLAEVPDDLADAADRVRARAASAHDLDGHTAWFALQTVLGAWPAPRERLWPALQKSFREAKLHTSWLRPDPDHREEPPRRLDRLDLLLLVTLVLPGAGWVLFDGLVTLLLALFIALHWPSSSAWAIGTLVGVSMIMSGVTRVMMSLAVRRLTEATTLPKAA